MLVILLICILPIYTIYFCIIFRYTNRIYDITPLSFLCDLPKLSKRYINLEFFFFF